MSIFSDLNKIFLLDGLGALLSAFLLGGVLTTFESIFGVPRNVLYILSALALILATYGLLCYLVAGHKNWKSFRILALLNLTYCCITIALLLIHLHSISSIGFLYFIVEILIILSLTKIEYDVSKKAN